MAQTGYTPILIYSSSTTSNVPAAGSLTNSTLGSELAINITDGKLFYKDNANAVQVIGWKVVPATAGGTGQTSYTTGDLLYASSSTALSKLADVATGNALISGGVGVAPSWGKIGLTTHISGILGVGNGGTGTATAFTAGSVVFAGASGVYSQNNANFFWDNSNNRLGLGVASPSFLLDARQSTDGGITYFRRIGGTFNPALKTVVYETGNLVGWDTDYSSSSPDYIWAIGGTTVLKLTSAGNITPTTAAKGINFTANTPASGMTSQLLNWYEEGTWTPVLRFGGGTTGITYTTQQGRYTRIGRTVTIRFEILLSNKGSSTGEADMTGLPFNAANLNAFSVYLYSGFDATYKVGIAYLNAGTISEIASYATAAFSDTQFTNTSRFWGTCTYQI